MNEFKNYRRTDVIEIRSYVKGEDMNDISVSSTDDPTRDMGMIARYRDDCWYIPKKYFDENYEEIIMETITLGKKVQDEITGFAGIAVSKCVNLDGSVWYLIQPPVNEKDEIPESVWIVKSQLVYMEGQLNS